MKKSLVLAMAMALGVTASAYAANPFSDVPAGHWAYDSVAKLAAAGVVDGYADGAFAGDKLITRYEMAQIVAKAMAKGADCDKLAAEFADELDTLGVRVAKLEKGADKVKIAGNIRASYIDSDRAAAQDTGRFRTRLVIKGEINEDWAYTGRLESNQYTYETGSATQNHDDDVVLNWAYVSGKIGGMKADIGRQTIKMHSGLIIDEYLDAAKLQYGKDYKFTFVAGKGASGLNTELSEDRNYIADVTTKVGVVDARVGYYKFEGHTKAGAVSEKEIYNVGATIPAAKGLKLSADWFQGDAAANAEENGYVFGLAFGGAKAAKVGSWGVYANYYDMPAAVYVEPTFEAVCDVPAPAKGVKGYEIGANYTVAKNIVAGVKYFDLEANEGKVAGEEAKTIWTEVVFTF